MALLEGSPTLAASGCRIVEVSGYDDAGPNVTAGQLLFAFGVSIRSARLIDIVLSRRRPPDPLAAVSEAVDAVAETAEFQLSQ